MITPDPRLNRRRCSGPFRPRAGFTKLRHAIWPPAAGSLTITRASLPIPSWLRPTSYAIAVLCVLAGENWYWITRRMGRGDLTIFATILSWLASRSFDRILKTADHSVGNETERQQINQGSGNHIYRALSCGL